MNSPVNDDFRELASEGDLNLSPLRAAWAARHIDGHPETRAILEEDARFFLHQSLSTPCLNAIVSAKGSILIDEAGREILDFHGNNVHQIGYGHPRVVEAIRKQIDELPFSPRRYTNRPAVELARRLTLLAPGDLSKVLFAPGGAEAVSMALKLARVATGRHKTVSMWDSFHGATLDAISVGGEAIFRRGAGPLLPGCEHAPPPNPDGCPFDCGRECNLKCADYIEYILEKEGDVAAVVGETMRAVPVVPPLDYWKRVRAACDRHGALLILDEIPTGLGRTGRMFVCEHYDVVPDILLIGKGLGGGVFPMAALLAREVLAVAGEGALGHFTHEKSPVGAAAALAVLSVIEEEGLLSRAVSLGEIFRTRLNGLREKHPSVGEIRGLGLFLGAPIVQPDRPDRSDSKRAERVLYECLERGLSFKTTMGSVLTLTPPLTVTEEEIDRAVGILDEALLAS